LFLAPLISNLTSRAFVRQFRLHTCADLILNPAGSKNSSAGGIALLPGNRGYLTTLLTRFHPACAKTRPGCSRCFQQRPIPVQIGAIVWDRIRMIESDNSRAQALRFWYLHPVLCQNSAVSSYLLSTNAFSCPSGLGCRKSDSDVRDTRSRTEF
jgi:hypothetical protein